MERTNLDSASRAAVARRRTSIRLACLLALAALAPELATAQQVRRIETQVRPRILVRAEGSSGKPIELTAFPAMGAYLGARTIDLSEDLRRHFEVPSGRGVMVSRVAEGSPAAAAGLAVGDVVLTVADVPVSNSEGLVREVRRHDPGTVVAIGILRQGVPQKLEATLAERGLARFDVGPLLWRQEPAGADAVEGVEAIGPWGLHVYDLDPVRLRKLAEDAAERYREGPGADKLEEMVEERQRALSQRIEELEKRLAELQAELDALGSARASGEEPPE